MVLISGRCLLCGSSARKGKRKITKYCPECRERIKPIDQTCHAMLCRIRDAHLEKFKMYRGISVCPEWNCGDHHSFILWSIYNGWAPGKMLDRIDGRKDYCPENCRWATPQENSQNRLYHATLYKRQERKCWCCQEVKPWTEFHKDCDDSTGYRRICKECTYKHKPKSTKLS